MKPQRHYLIAAGLAAAIGLGAAVQAQTPPAGPTGRPDAARMEQFRARMQERMAQRLAELKAKLAVTPAQEGAWTAWTSALKPTPHQRPDRAEIARLTTPERIDRMRAVRAQRNADTDKRMDATKTFYAQLNAEQTKTFDAESIKFLGGKGGHHGGGHGHGRGHGHGEGRGHGGQHS